MSDKRNPDRAEAPGTVGEPSSVARVTYHLHEGRPARVTHHDGAQPSAEYLNPDGTWTDADAWKVTVDGNEAPDHVVLDYWQHHQPDVV
jgi:hypothetical protein